ncbi:ATP-dependent RNA helicase ded1 [Marasmius tenuissimus]|nr:ATP-dependent RNA helicase ded1 [Marasmius tenuissimus]
MTNALVNGSAGIESKFESLNLSKSAYVPPHLRSQQRAASSPNLSNGNGWNDSRNDSRSSTPTRFESRGGAPFNDRGRGGGAFSSSRGGGMHSNNNWNGNGNNNRWSSRDDQPRENAMYGFGVWKDGRHVVGQRNMRIEKEIYGDASDPSKQHTGINFEKYDDIPVEATGAGVPEPVTSFTSPPLDPVLLENIGYARYTTPTPVQKYSIPIVANGRDLMACAQTGSGKTGGFLFPILSASFTNGPRPPPAETAPSYGRGRKAYPTALILAPTRELVSQIHDEARKFAYRSWVRPAVVYGGADISSRCVRLNVAVTSSAPLPDVSSI